MLWPCCPTMRASTQSARLAMRQSHSSEPHQITATVTTRAATLAATTIQETARRHGTLFSHFQALRYVSNNVRWRRCAGKRALLLCVIRAPVDARTRPGMIMRVDFVILPNPTKPSDKHGAVVGRDYWNLGAGQHNVPSLAPFYDSVDVSHEDPPVQPASRACVISSICDGTLKREDHATAGAPLRRQHAVPVCLAVRLCAVAIASGIFACHSNFSLFRRTNEDSLSRERRERV